MDFSLGVPMKEDFRHKLGNDVRTKLRMWIMIYLWKRRLMYALWN